VLGHAAAASSVRFGRGGGAVSGRVEAMEKRLDATLSAVKTVQPPLAKFYNSLSDEQKGALQFAAFGPPAG
jgi:hypothetical protein